MLIMSYKEMIPSPDYFNLSYRQVYTYTMTYFIISFIILKDFIHVFYNIYYSSPSLIRPPYLSTKCGHIRKVAFGEGGYTLIVVAEKIYNLI